jgi:hypothetical protein
MKTPSPIPVLAASTTLTFPTITAALSRRLAVPIIYRERPRGEMQRLYGEFGAVFEDMYSYFREWGFAGEEKFVGRQEVCESFPLLCWGDGRRSGEGRAIRAITKKDIC